MNCPNCDDTMSETIPNLHACTKCGWIVDYTYEQEIAYSPSLRACFVGRFRSADAQSNGAGLIHIVLADEITSARKYGDCIDTDKAIGICELWVSEGRIGAGFQRPKQVQS